MGSGSGPQDSGLVPLAEGVDVGGASVSVPTVELARFFQLLTATHGRHNEATIDVRKRRHITP